MGRSRRAREGRVGVATTLEGGRGGSTLAEGANLCGAVEVRCASREENVSRTMRRNLEERTIGKAPNCKRCLRFPHSLGKVAKSSYRSLLSGVEASSWPRTIHVVRDGRAYGLCGRGAQKL